MDSPKSNNSSSRPVHICIVGHSYVRLLQEFMCRYHPEQYDNLGFNRNRVVVHCLAVVLSDILCCCWTSWSWLLSWKDGGCVVYIFCRIFVLLLNFLILTAELKGRWLRCVYILSDILCCCWTSWSWLLSWKDGGCVVYIFCLRKEINK